MKPPGEETMAYFRRYGIRSAETLSQCGVRQVENAVLPHRPDAPSIYAVIPFSRKDALTGMASIDLLVPGRQAVGDENGAAARGGSASASSASSGDLRLQLERDMEGYEPSEPTLWGYDEALKCSGSSAHSGEGTGDLLVVEDVLERLALVEAGLPVGRVVALPPGAHKAFASRKPPARGGARGGASRKQQQGSFDGGQPEREAISYAMQAEDLFGRYR